VCAAGIGLAMTPATDAILGALPPDQFGVGSAVNDTTREIGGALGVAILGSLFASSYANQLRPQIPAGVPEDIARVVTGSLAGALAVAEQLGGAVGEALVTTAQQAFVSAMSMTSVIGAVIVLAGVLVAVVWMPNRPKDALSPEPAAGSASAVADIPLARDHDHGEHGGQPAGGYAKPDGALQ
jgi:hypothetical protein